MTAQEPALRAGDQLASTVCTTRVVVVRAPADGHHVIACGGSPMVAADATQQPPRNPAADAATLIGKRYVDGAQTLELLCTSSGTGSLTFDGAPMTVKAPKPLPASD